MSYLPYYRRNNYSSSRYVFKHTNNRWSTNTQADTIKFMLLTTHECEPRPLYIISIAGFLSLTRSLACFLVLLVSPSQSLSLRLKSLGKDAHEAKYKQDYFSNPNKHRHFAYCLNIVRERTVYREQQQTHLQRQWFDGGGVGHSSNSCFGSSPFNHCKIFILPSVYFTCVLCAALCFLHFACKCVVTNQILHPNRADKMGPTKLSNCIQMG